MSRSVVLSLVVPMFNEEDSLDHFFNAVQPILETITPDYEIVCVNDGSSDGTAARLREYCARDSRVKLVDLSRNFGKEAALTAGIEFATGAAVVPIDADLQDPPEVLGDMVNKWREGWDVVLGIRSDRSTDSWAKRASAGLFYRAMGGISDVKIPPNAGDFRLMDRRVVEALKRLPERTRFMKGLFGWLGFRYTAVYFRRPERSAGTTKWNFWKLWNFALDGVFSFSTLPLRIWTYVGAVITLLSALYVLFIVVRTLLFGVDVPGYASLACLVLFFAGVNMITLGVIGEYIGRIFIEVKQRPLYLVRESVGFDHATRTPR